MNTKFNPFVDDARAQMALRFQCRDERYKMAQRNYYVGALVILVGDRPGPSAPTELSFVHVPFLSMKHCSGWLNTLLENNGIPEDKLLWFNAYDVDGNPNNFTSLKKQTAAEIIALGKNAERWLQDNGCTHYIPEYHPQYWKRFHSKEPYPLIDKLSKLTRKNY